MRSIVCLAVQTPLYAAQINENQQENLGSPVVEKIIKQTLKDKVPEEIFDSLKNKNIKKLIRICNVYQPDLNFVYKDETPLIKAILLGDLQLIRFLIQHGADVNFSDELLSPLMWAANDSADNTKSIEIIKLLVEHGADINLQNKNGESVLYISHDPQKIKLLIDLGAYVNVSDKNGKTVLMEAAFRGPPEIVKLLIEEGAEKDTIDNKGKKALDYARSGGPKREMAIEQAITEGVRERSQRIQTSQTAVAQHTHILPDVAGIISEYMHGERKK